MEGINKYSKEWFALYGNSEYMAKAESLKDGIENSDKTHGFKLDGSLFLGDKETVMNNIEAYYQNSNYKTVDIINNMQVYGAENIFNVLDGNSDGIVTEDDLSDLAATSGTREGSNCIDTYFSTSDFQDYYKNAMNALNAIVEHKENVIKITYDDGEYTELKTDENGIVYSKYYEKNYNTGRLGVEYDTKDNSTTKTYMDSLHRPTSIIYDKEGEKFDSVTYYTYNDDGSKVVEFETVGKKVITEYDSNGDTISENIELKYNSDRVIDDTNQQVENGDCWLLSGINALRATEKGAEIIKNSIQQNDDGSVSVYLNGVNKSYTYTPEDIGAYISTYHSSGDNDMDIIEMAIADFRSENISNGNRTAYCENLELYIPEDVTLEEPLNGGIPSEAIYYLTGINCKGVAIGDTKEKKTELLNEYLQSDKSDIAATISFLEIDETIGKSIRSGHTYSIIGTDDENVYVENPWNAGESIAYPIDKIKENIAQISLTYLSDENKHEESNLEEKNATFSNEKANILEKIENFFEKIGTGIKSLFKNLF